MNPAPKVDFSADAVTAYNSMIAVKDNPDRLAAEVAKWPPSIIFQALRMDAGRVLPIAGHFIGTGIDILDPGIC